MSVRRSRIPAGLTGATGAAGIGTLISDTTLGADTASFDVTGISGSYNTLFILASVRSTNATDNDPTKLTFNNDTGNNYTDQVMTAQNTTLSGGATAARGFINLGSVPAASGTAGFFGAYMAWIPNYAGTTTFKPVIGYVTLTSAADTTKTGIGMGSGLWASTSAITRVTLTPFAGTNFKAGSRFSIYAV